jgi:hypothetical protein
MQVSVVKTTRPDHAQFPLCGPDFVFSRDAGSTDLHRSVRRSGRLKRLEALQARG